MLQSSSLRNLKPSKKLLVATASAALITTLTILEKSLDGVPAPGLKAAVGGMLEIIKVVKKRGENAQDLNELDIHLKDLSDVLLSIPNKDITEDLNNRIKKLTSDIEGIVESCGDLRSQSSTLKLFNHQDNASTIAGINRLIDRAIQTFQLGGIIAVEQGIAGIKKHLERSAVPQDPNDPLDTLRPHIADARYNSASRIKVSRCFEGTRSDLLQKIYDWADDPSAKAIYWLCGLAGTGKSTIAQTVAETLKQRKMLGASFFFSRDVAERSNPYRVFPTIAYQLGHFHKTFSSRIATSLRDHPDTCTSLLETQIENLITEPLREVGDAPPVIAIVVDALDECSNEVLVQEMLILLAASIPQLPFRTKIFITSRPDIHIRSKFNEDVMKSVSEASLLHDIDLSVVQHDIGLYLEYHLHKLGEEMLRDVAWPNRSEIDVLVGRARGLFIYASASLAYIGDKGQRQPKERLLTLLSDKPASMESPPYTEVDNLYRHILRSSLPQVGAWGVASRLQPILGTIVMLLDPLPIYAMERLIVAKEGSTIPMLYSLHAVLSVPDDPEEPIRVFHKSFPDFMLDPYRCTDSRLLVKPEIYHGQLALQCLNVMNSDLRRNICGIKDPFILNADIENLHLLLEEKVGYHVIYACRFWAAHLKYADPADQPLRDAVSEFITTKLLFWLEVLSLAMHVDSALVSLKIAQDWYQEEEPKRLMLVRKMIPVVGPSNVVGQYLRSSEEKLKSRLPVKTLLHDCQCLLLRFLDIVTRSATHLYHSALPFAPDCLLYKQFGGELQDSGKILSRDSAWDPVLAVLNGHSHSVQSVCFSPDGLRIASGSYDNSVRIWDSTTGTHIRTLNGHSDSVVSVCFSPDGLRIASGSRDKSVCIWDSTTGTHIRTLNGHSDWVQSVCFSPDGLRIASGSSDNSVRIWDSTTGTHIRTLNGHSDWVQSVCFSPDGLRIASGSDDKSVQIWDSTTGTHIRTLNGHSHRVQSVCFSPDGLRIASGSYDNSVRIWDSTTGTHIRTLNGHSHSVQSVCFSPDGLRIASGSDDKSVRIWDSTTGTHIRTLNGHSASVQSVKFVHGSYICSKDSTGMQILWDHETSKQLMAQDAEKLLSGLNVDPPGQSSSVPLETKGNLCLDDGSIALYSLPSSPQHQRQRLTICYLPFSDISCHAFFDYQLVIGTKAGKVHIMDFASPVALLY